VRSAVRPTTPEDAPGISQLLWEVGLRPNSRIGDLQWKYWQHIGQRVEPRSFVLTRGGELLAHAGIVPRTYVWGSQRFEMLQIVDWAARHDAVGAGVSLMKHLRRSVDALVSVGGSAQTLGILPHIGFRRHGNVSTFVRPLHPLRILQASVNRPTWKRVPRLVRNAFWRLTAPSPHFEDFDVRLSEPHDAAALGTILPKSTPQLAVLERKVELLQHALGCPITQTDLYSLQQGNRLRGYFLLAYAPGQVRLIDSWIDSSDARDWRALIYCAIREAYRDRRSAELVTYASDPELANHLRACGFHSRGAQPIMLLARDGVQIPPTTLRVQMLDNDAAYQHLGRPDFAA
jgi:hypothetical protein